MSILDKLNLLNSRNKDDRGKADQETLDYINQQHDIINEDQAMKELANTKGMKSLIKQIRDWLVKVDEVICNTQIPHEKKMDIIALKEAYIKVLKVLEGADSRLEVIERQLDYQLKEE